MISENDAAMFLAQGEVLGSDDRSIGRVGQLYLDHETEVLTWVTVRTSLFGNNESFIPLEQATYISNIITVPYNRGFVDHAPRHEPGCNLTVQDEDELYLYYRLRRHTSPADNPATGAADCAVELTSTGVGTSRVRLRKYVVAEPQPVEAPLSHEGTQLVSKLE